MKKAKKRAILISSISLIALVFVMVISGVVIGATDRYAKFTKSVFINGDNMKGYTVQKAGLLVQEKVQREVKDLHLKLVHGDDVWQFDEKDFDVDDAVQKVVNNAFWANKISKKDSVNYIAGKTNNFKTAICDVIKNFDEKLEEIEQRINQPAQDAKVEFVPDQKPMFVVCDEHNGVEVDRDKLMLELKNKFFDEKDITIEIPTIQTKPSLTKEYFADKLNLQSKFTTSIKNSQAGRRNNVTVALKKLNGLVVKPDEIVSFNKITSPQDASGGYQNAIVIVNGEYVNGIGGGICQASTTLYNALVLANLEIDEVHKHTIPVHYVEHALDAMISDGYADLIFKNNSEDDIYIKSYVLGDDATVEIYGKSLPDGVTIKRVMEETVIPHNGDRVVKDETGEYANKVLYEGEYYRLKWPTEGYDAKAYKEYYRDGKLTKREEIRHEKYQPEEGIVIEGGQKLPEGFVLPKQDVVIYPPLNQQ